MPLALDPDLPHQRAAIDAVLQCLGPASRGPAGRPGPANRAPWTMEALERRVRVVQQQAGLPASGPRFEVGEVTTPHLAIDMETGTGKTYTLIRTALELAAAHALSRFVIVVPSIAVREGVLSTLASSRAHFAQWLPHVPYRFFAYDGRVEPAARFARGHGVQFAVLTIDAFNKSINRFRRPHDACGGQSPLQLWQTLRPVLLLDEPHHLETPLRVQALAQLHPCLAIRYGATHRDTRGLVHRLTAAQAREQGLVKRIEVVAAPHLEPREARISHQLGAMIDAHLERQAALVERGIKVLSLVFVERVDDVALPDGVVRRLFDHHFERVRTRLPAWAHRRPDEVRAAYFARDRRGRATRARPRSQAELDAVRLILRDKARLLSLEEPVSFVFSHSALREGWDNPNIFQLCMLGRSSSTIKMRQEIGRGIRLCVDATGRRVRDPDVDVLSVFAHESYDELLAELQREHDPGMTVVSPSTRRASKLSASPRPPPCAGERVPSLREACRRLQAQTFDSRPLEHAVEMPNLVDLVLALYPSSGTPRSRREIVQCIDAVPANAWLREPHRVAQAIANALCSPASEVEHDREDGRRGEGSPAQGLGQAGDVEGGPSRGHGVSHA